MKNKINKINKFLKVKKKMERAAVESRECIYAKSLQSCPTLCDCMDCSPPGSSVQGFPGGSEGEKGGERNSEPRTLTLPHSALPGAWIENKSSNPGFSHILQREKPRSEGGWELLKTT